MEKAFNTITLVSYILALALWLIWFIPYLSGSRDDRWLFIAGWGIMLAGQVFNLVRVTKKRRDSNDK